MCGKLVRVACAFGALALLAACAPHAGDGTSPQQYMYQPGYLLTRCDGQVVPTTRAAPPAAPVSAYVGAVSTTTRNLAGYLYAFAAEDGSARWCNQFTPKAAPPPCPYSCPAPSSVIPGRPLVRDGVVYVCVSGYGGYTYAFNARAGALRWMQQTDCQYVSIPFGDYAAPLLANGVLYTGKVALHAQDGRLLWRLPIDATFASVVDGTLYAYGEAMVYALNPANGAVRWKHQLGNVIACLPTIADGTVYVGEQNSVGSDTAVTTALNASTGALLWTYHASSFSILAAGGTVYLEDAEGVAALDARSGQPRWHFPITMSSIALAAVLDGTLYLSADGAYALNASDGSARWHNTLGADQSHSFSTGVVQGDTFYLVGEDGMGNSTLFALRLSDGRARWQQANIPQMTPPALGFLTVAIFPLLYYTFFGNVSLAKES